MRKFLLVVLICMCLAQVQEQGIGLRAQEILEERAFKMVVSAGWKRTDELPQGFDIGFRKRLSDGRQATLFLHHEIMPPEAGEIPSDTSDMQRQWNTMVRNNFPDANPLKTPAVQAPGKIILNKMYDLTDTGVKVKRRYTYFVADRTAFVVQCTAPPGYWEAMVVDFDGMILSLKPRAGATVEKISDQAAVSNLKRDLPTLTGSFPTQWVCSIADVKIVRLPSQESKGTLEIRLAWDRLEIEKIYKATKTLFRMMGEDGFTDQDLEKFQDETGGSVDESVDFMSYAVAQVWGCAWIYVANCELPIDRFKIIILDSKRQNVGSVSISRKDASDILTDKISESDWQTGVRVYEFE